MSNRMVAVLVVNAGFSRAARPGGRKVRTPQSSVPDNVREGALVARFGAALERLDGKCHRKYTAAGRVSETVRAVLLEPDARVKQAQAVAEPLD